MSAAMRPPRPARVKRCSAVRWTIPFFVDLGGIFDLGDAPRQIGTPKDGLACMNVSTIVIQVPISTLQKNDLDASMRQRASSIPNFVIGVWASASRQQMRTLSTDGTEGYTGNWVQVSRLGMPLTNEAVIPIGNKDLLEQSLTPYEDLANLAHLRELLLQPGAGLYMDDDLFGGAVPRIRAAAHPAQLRSQAFDFGNGKDGLYRLEGNGGGGRYRTRRCRSSERCCCPADNSPRSVDLWPIFHTGVPNLAPYQSGHGQKRQPARGRKTLHQQLPAERRRHAAPEHGRDTDPAQRSDVQLARHHRGRRVRA